MSHEVETMAYANEVPWHGLGTKVEGDVTSDEFLKAAGLDWTVSQHQNFIELEGEKIYTGKVSLVRDTDHQIFTTSSERWTPMQNKEVLGFMDEYVRAGGATLETAGSLRGGRVIWALANLGRGFSVTKGDDVKGYLLLTSPHEMGSSITLRTTTVRVVCANTMAAANQEGTITYRQNHLSAFNVDAAREAVAEAHEDLAAAERRAKTLSKLKLSMDDAVKKVLLPVMAPAALDHSEIMDGPLDEAPLPKQIREIMDSINTAPGHITTPKGTTGWGVMNGVTHWADHVAGRVKEGRLYYSWYGTRSTQKQKIEETLMELAS